MAQRVGLARALVRKPDLLLLDEPLGALDALTRHQLQGELVRLHQAVPRTTLLVTHDVHEAVRLADHVSLLANGRLVRTWAVGGNGSTEDDRDRLARSIRDLLLAGDAAASAPHPGMGRAA